MASFCSSVILKDTRAHTPHKNNSSPSSTSLASTKLSFNTVYVTPPTSLLVAGNYFAQRGFQQRSFGHIPCSASAFWISFTSFRHKTRQTFTTSTTPLFASQIVPVYLLRSYVAFLLVCRTILTYNQHRYNEISLVFRMWIHLHLLKRGGGGHQTSSIESLADGSIAVECPACPHPDRNVTIDMLDDE